MLKRLLKSAWCSSETSDTQAGLLILCLVVLGFTGCGRNGSGGGGPDFYEWSGVYR